MYGLWWKNRLSWWGVLQNWLLYAGRDEFSFFILFGPERALFVPMVMGWRLRVRYGKKSRKGFHYIFLVFCVVVGVGIEILAPTSVFFAGKKRFVVVSITKVGWIEKDLLWRFWEGWIAIRIFPKSVSVFMGSYEQRNRQVVVNWLRGDISRKLMLLQRRCGGE